MKPHDTGKFVHENPKPTTKPPLDKSIKQAMMLGPINEMPQRLEDAVTKFMTKGTPGSSAHITFEFAKADIWGRCVIRKWGIELVVPEYQLAKVKSLCEHIIPVGLKVKIRRRRWYDRQVIGFYTVVGWW